MSFNKLSLLPAAVLTIALGALANPARASAPFLVSDFPITPATGITLNPNQSDFGQFTLTAPASTGISIIAYLKDAGGGTLATNSNFSASIVNDNAGLPGGTTILSSTGDNGTFSTSSFGQINFTIPNATAIPAGTYWVKITYANVTADSVLFGDAASITNAGNDGTINQKVYDGSSITTDFGAFEVAGSLAPVPEPMSLSLLALGAPALLLRRRKTVPRA